MTVKEFKKLGDSFKLSDTGGFFCTGLLRERQQSLTAGDKAFMFERLEGNSMRMVSKILK